MLRRIVLGVLLALIPCAAFAAPAVVTTVIGGGASASTTYSASISPANGNILTVTVLSLAVSGGVPTSVTDSASNTLTLRKSATLNAAGSVLIYDEVASGSITSVSCNSNAAQSCSVFGVLNMSRANSAGSFVSNTGVTSTATTGPLSPILPTDILFCGIVAFGGETITISNSTGLTSLYDSSPIGGLYLYYATSTSTTSTCTASGTSTWAAAMSDYTGSPIVGGCGPYPWPCAFQGG
jgi:hypothetical protein